MKFKAEDDQLSITFEGAEIFFAVKRKISIPRSAIVSLEWQPEYSFPGGMWRVLGSDIPGVLWAGRFRARGQKFFLYLRGPRGLTWTQSSLETQQTLIITTQGFSYDQILLTCDPDIGASLLNWRAGN